MPVTAGQMNKKVTIESSSLIEDETNQPQPTWFELCRVWAAVEPLSTRELFSAQQAQVIATHKVTIYHRVDVESQAALLRVRYRRDGENSERILSVVSGTAANDSKARQLELLCAEAQPWPT